MRSKGKKKLDITTKGFLTDYDSPVEEAEACSPPTDVSQEGTSFSHNIAWPCEWMTTLRFGSRGTV